MIGWRNKLCLFALATTLLFNKYNFVICFSAVSKKKSRVDSGRPTLADLQKCVTPRQILQDVAGRLDPEGNDGGILASTVLVRLSKQIIAYENKAQIEPGLPPAEHFPWQNLDAAIASLCSILGKHSNESLETLVEGTKAAVVLCRFYPSQLAKTCQPLISEWNRVSADSVAELQPHQLSGLKWSMDVYDLCASPSVKMSIHLQEAYDELNLPFQIRPGFLDGVKDLSVQHLTEQVDFQTDQIQTVSNRVVQERRQTAWEGDDGVAPFEYSGKSMPRKSWSPVVKEVRDVLFENGGVYYDGCLLNLYPDGDSGMRYHIDPDQGTLWDYNTTVVSIGATRKFAFRSIKPDGSERTDSLRPHVFTLMQGDCTDMFDDCQTRFQHTVKTAETNNEASPRASLVFKKTLTNS